MVIDFIEAFTGPKQALEIGKVGAARPACRLDLRGQKGLARAAKIPSVSGRRDVGCGLNDLPRIQCQTDGLLGIPILFSLIELAHCLNKSGLLDTVGNAKGLSVVNLPQRYDSPRLLEGATVVC